MRPISNFALHALAATALTAFAAAGAAAQKNQGFLALGDSIPAGSAASGRGGQLEVESWHWGTAQSVAKVDSFAVKQGVKPAGKDGAKGGNVEFEWKVEEGESAPPPPGGVRVASGDVNGDPDRPVIVGNVPNASAGKRQHGPVTITKEVDKATPAQVAEKRQHGWTTVSKPLDRGAVRVKVKFPWAGCAVGARYPVITLGDGAGSYRLQDVTVASCGRSGDADDRPTEEVAFYYNKIAFNSAK